MPATKSDRETNSTMHRRATLTASLALLGALGFIGSSYSQDWPQRPVKIIVPFAAGGMTDGLTRIVAQPLSSAFKQQIIVENRPGATGAVAAEAVARAPADGYTLFMATLPQIAIVPAMTKTRYDPMRDFVPISIVVTSASALVVNAQVPVQTLSEFVDYARARPNKLSYASGGHGTHNQLGMVLFLTRAGLEMVHVPYQGGAPAMTDVVAGHVPVMLANLSDVLPHMASGKIRVLAVANERRARQISNVPTINESGFPGFSIDNWNGLMAPAGTPRDIIRRLAAEVTRAVKDPGSMERFTNLGVEPLGGSPEEFAARIAEDIPRWTEAVRLAEGKSH